ncbi:MAG: hypothetical protein UU64_C0011G0054 [candidate division WWE3 bacterium GW2011_GWF2_41_45]|uniref:Transcription elongation factor GreA/GreB N-terminal domain-containing protein n=3 Tax=Katanobacteria TaxID=422282 RepID=A0A1F4W0Z3_UNCKA|nr:MAG: hypothetical protein UU55_C0012G0054 [candidate division WWE3 bacterium GW2011_GWC2_41_23]KKS10037.1 MAG: hypothetical protein UU64_C0011G0054 [candidate division WWE3 bacterium GW2011_GWF2_41_45]KKS11997.1 MAG: hypothetical protein UU68_C0007G0054 [candidate division WWE3 bacterium GW2011_GWF1_41_53]KKS19887.1 MAG: hypothetical protein UU79_C0008G0054 [candidate division WWE3 bacterium GW2011_GWE1_41_72]KKS27038.1 MAG: hypothetical protein UU86_C0026G0004 [candidate division WWE3 bacte
MNKEEKVDHLRERLSEQRKKLEEATFEKGLAAEENKDLRENFAYDYWVSQEQLITARIFATLKEIEHLTKKPRKKIIKKNKTTPVERVKDLPKKKWL